MLFSHNNEPLKTQQKHPQEHKGVTTKLYLLCSKSISGYKTRCLFNLTFFEQAQDVQRRQNKAVFKFGGYKVQNKSETSIFRVHPEMVTIQVYVYFMLSYKHSYIHCLQQLRASFYNIYLISEGC
jgi:hypothetical protein